MLIRMKSQVAREREGDLTMDATVVRIYTEKTKSQEENPAVVVIDSQSQGDLGLSSDVAAMLKDFKMSLSSLVGEKPQIKLLNS